MDISPENAILAHMNKKEVESLSRAQGSLDMNPELKIPEFAKLSEMLSNPKIKNLLSYGIKRLKNKSPEERSQLLNGLDEEADAKYGDESKYGNFDESGMANQLGKDGMNGDTEMVALTPELYEFLKQHAKEAKLNPKDGLPQFFSGMELISFLGDALPYVSEGLKLFGLFSEESDKNTKAEEHAEAMRQYEKRREEQHNKYADSFSSAYDLRTGKKQNQDPEREFAQQMQNISRSRFKDGGEIIDPIKKIKNLDKSGYLKGNSKGQADNIHTEAPEGGYIIDASTVSALGDGNSDAGAREIDSYLKSLGKEYKNGSKKKMIRCALSNGEYEISDEHAEAIGGGNISQGHDILGKSIKLIRTSKGFPVEKIPAKAKPFEAYINIAKSGRSN